MIFKKLFAFLLVVWLVFQTTAAAQTTIPDDKRDELPPELKQNALKLLASVARETQQFKLPENRIRIQTIVADLIWEHDEDAARAMFQNALGDLQNLLPEINLPEDLEMNTTERSAHYNERYKIAELRKDLILTLVMRDSPAALAALAALKVRLLEEYDPMDTSELELQITAAIAKKSPDKSYEVAKQQLDANGVNYQFVETLKNLHRKDSELAANLGKDVLTKIKNLKIRIPDSAAINPNPANPKTEIEFTQISHFARAAAEMNRRAAQDKEKKIVPLLSDAAMRELVEIIANAFLTTSNPAPYIISTTLPEILRLAPELAQRIRLKIGEEASRQVDKGIEIDRFYFDSREKSSEELAKIAETSAPEFRDSRFSVAAFKAIEENEPEKAQAIADRIKDRKNYKYLFEQIEAAAPLVKAQRGDLEEVRKMLATFKTREQKIETLTELASALAAKGEHETANVLLDESLQMMPALLRKQTDLQLAAKIARVYSLAAPEKAFTMVENSIGQMNEYINSGIKMDEFYGGGSVEAEELPFNTMNKQVLMYVPNSFFLIKNLGRADFERTAALADKFERPEIRLYVRLRIAQSLLDAKADEKEQKDHDRLTGGDEMN